METGKLIKELRLKKGMTQEELTDKTEVSARTIQRIENGEVDPRAYTLQMIARALEVDYSLFTEHKPDEEQEIQQANARTWLRLLHFSGIIPLIFPTVLIWHQKKDKVKGISVHYRDVISFQLMVWVGILAGLWIYWRAHVPIPLIMVFLVNAVISIVNTVRVVSGEPYRHVSFFRSGKKGEKAG
ncbi:MAG: helix-turn-helix domain-containing protein [Bacteroidales bacterium]|nr:helix-turn-helix domain-containing protein [Bacteroidales bacterium]MDT8373265.1 helix-turn-helix domain-containing protein [Bacteroidales bacterium]